MADSTEDLRRELEEFEKGDAAPEVRASVPEAPSPFPVPKWVLWMVVADLIIGVAIVVVIFT